MVVLRYAYARYFFLLTDATAGRIPRASCEYREEYLGAFPSSDPHSGARARPFAVRLLVA